MVRPNNTERILADGILMSNNSKKTGLNNNDCIIASSGSGKTYSYVMPNLLNTTEESIVVADTKSNLYEQFGPILEKRGYRVLKIDFKEMTSNVRWNPLDYIPFDKNTNAYSEKAIKSVAKLIIPDDDSRDPFWYHAAREYCSLLISYVMDFLPDEEHTLEYAYELFRIIDSNTFVTLMQEASTYYPSSTVARIWETIQGNRDANKLHHSITAILSSYINNITLEPALVMYKHTNKFRFREIGNKRTALFVNISDHDRSLDALVGLFYSQMFQDLIEYADNECEEQRLPIPVRIILDDYAANYRIANMFNLACITRSREIYISIILQSINQLNALYGEDKAATLLDQFDNVLYFGGQSLETARYIATRANLPENEILNMKMGTGYLFTRGQEPRKIKRYDITTHSRYHELQKDGEEQKCTQKQ